MHDVRLFHAAVDRHTRRLTVLHAPHLKCARGCSSCCVDGLTVFDVEAAPIRASYPGLLESGVPHAAGGCAFLDEVGACRIYEDRPYVCRTQGLPLRWLEEGEAGAVELRDICPLNDEGERLLGTPADDCFTIGPFEGRLAELQVEAGSAPRVALRDLFRTTAAAPLLVGAATSPDIPPVR